MTDVTIKPILVKGKYNEALVYAKAIEGTKTKYANTLIILILREQK